jgi:hypothetical protein
LQRHGALSHTLSQRLAGERSVVQATCFVTHGGSLKPRYLFALLAVMVLSMALACRDDVINGWPRGHALLQGSVLRRGDVPYEGPLFVTCDGYGLLFRTTAPGQYHDELSWSFHTGVPADSLECEVRADKPSFAAAHRVLFVPLNVATPPHTLDVMQP